MRFVLSAITLTATSAAGVSGLHLLWKDRRHRTATGTATGKRAASRSLVGAWGLLSFGPYLLGSSGSLVFAGAMAGAVCAIGALVTGRQASRQSPPR